MSATTIAYDIIARDMASKAFLGVAASAKEQQAAVTKSFAAQEQVAKRATQQIRSTLRAEESEMMRAAKSAEKYGKATSYLNSHKESLDKVARGLTVIGGAAAVGFGAAVKASMDYNDAMARVAAFSDDARSHMGELRKLSMTVGTQMGFSATQSANAMEELVKAGVSTTDMIRGGLKGSLALAAAGQIDVSQATGIAASAMTQFGLAGSKIPHVADLLAAGADKALGGVGDLGEALSYSGVQAHQYKVSIEGTIGTLAAFAQNGQLGSMAGTTFSQMLARLGAPTGKAAKAMKDLHLSAYDAKGDFVTMPVLAGRLQKAFEHLSPAQRNAAEQTIFGQRAIRGANVLINEGSSGISDWIKKVNDQGFAAQTAGRKMDSLKGDLTKLNASFQIALIGAGNGSQGPLRQAVEALTKYINAWNNLSDTAKSNIGKIVGAIAVIGLGGAAAIKVLGFLAAGKKALIDLGITGKAAGAEIAAGAETGGAAMVGLKGAVGAAAIAYAGLLASGQLDKLKANTVAGTGEVTGALVKLSNQSGTTKADLDSLFHTSAWNANSLGPLIQADNLMEGAKSQVNGLNDALTRTFNRGVGTQVTDWMTGVVHSLGGASGTFQTLQQEFSQVDSSLTNLASSGSGARAADAFQKIAAAAGKNHVSIQQLMTLFPQYRASLQQQANDLKVTNLTARDYAAWMGGRVPAAIKRAIVAQDKAKSGNNQFGATVKTTAQIIQDETNKLIKNRNAYIKDANAAISASNDTIAYHQAVADASKAIKENGHTLDENTQKGRDNRSALNNLASAALTHVQDLIKEHKSQKDVTAATVDARKKFIEIARQMNLTKGQAQKLATQFGLNKKKMDAIPKTVHTTVTAPGITRTIDDVKSLITTVGKVNGKTVTIKYNVMAGGSAVKVQGHGGITATDMGGGFSVGGHAAGGPIHGPGTATSDSILTALSNGEYVHRAKSRAYYGDQAMADINNMRIPREALRRASGGPINRNVRLNTVIPSGSASFLGSALAGTQSMIDKATIAALKKAMSDGSMIPPMSGGSGVARWAPLILQALAMLGQPASLLGAVERRMAQESGGNPGIVNHWDANAKAGHPSQGLMQTIPGTFAAYAGPFRGRGILDPMANIYAGLNYALHNYPSLAYAMNKSGGYATGGRIVGPGTGTSDSIPIWASNGETVMTAAASKRFGPILAMMNGQHFATGGRVSPSTFGSSYTFSVAAIVALIRSIANPIRDLSTATTDLKKATAANAAAQKLVAKHAPLTRNMDRASSAYTRERTRQSNLRLTNARQTNAARASVAGASDRLKAAQLGLQRLAPQSAKVRAAQSKLTSAESHAASVRRSAAASIAALEDRIRATKRGSLAYQNLLAEKSLKEKANARSIAVAEAAVTKAKQAANKAGVNTAKISRAQAKVTAAQNALDAARAKQSKVSRDNALETATASAKVAAALSARQKATDAYNKALDTAKQKASDLKDATDALAQAQQQVADATKQTSDSFTSLYNQPAAGGSITDLWQSMRKGAGDLTAFSALIDRLRKKGLSESIIGQILSTAQSSGVAAGSALAQQALNGGTYLIKLLNTAAQQLQDAGDVLGYKTAVSSGAGYATGVNFASSGIRDVAENGAELVLGRQRRRFNGGEKVFNAKDTAAMLGGGGDYYEIHLHEVFDSKSAAIAIKGILRDDDRIKGGVKQVSRTRTRG